MVQYFLMMAPDQEQDIPSLINQIIQRSSWSVNQIIESNRAS